MWSLSLYCGSLNQVYFIMKVCVMLFVNISKVSARYVLHHSIIVATMYIHNRVFCTYRLEVYIPTGVVRLLVHST